MTTTTHNLALSVSDADRFTDPTNSDCARNAATSSQSSARSTTTSTSAGHEAAFVEIAGPSYGQRQGIASRLVAAKLAFPPKWLEGASGEHVRSA